MGRAKEISAVDQAFLALMRVETELNINAAQKAPTTSARAEALASLVHDSIETLRGAIKTAKRILEDGKEGGA